MTVERKPLGLYVAATVFLLVIISVVGASFMRPEPLSFSPTAIQPQPDREGFVIDTITIDARDGSQWIFFNFEIGSVIEDPPSDGWDLAINRFHMVTNGGTDYAGEGGALALPLPWDSVTEAPRSGYTVTDGRLGDSAPATTPALERWYEYSFFAHTLQPKNETYVIRTAAGHYAKLEIVSYYCLEATPGCMTVVYGYQNDGSLRLTP
jgi:hypothetical protein